MKTALKLIGGLLVGIVVGFLIAGVGVVLFTDTTVSEFIEKLYSTSGIEAAGAVLVAMIAAVIAVLILIPFHEAGHLVCGMLTGYKFVSFRIFNFTFIKIDGKLRIKRFGVAGTGGQCLMIPPEMPLEQIPTEWYNAGGVLANFLILLVILQLLWLDLNPFLSEGIVIFCLIDFFFILTNGIPMKLGGIGNDGYNMLHLNRNLLSKRAFVLQLRTNALVQDGMRPKDMPDEWFEWNTDIDFKNPLEVSIPMMYASRLIDKLNFEEAYLRFEEIYSHKNEIMKLYVNEIACELAFCAMVTGRVERAEEILDKDLLKYIESYSKVMSSKQRLLSAKSRYIDNDEEKAVRIYEDMKVRQSEYLLQGEVKSDLAIMEHLYS